MLGSLNSKPAYAEADMMNQGPKPVAFKTMSGVYEVSRDQDTRETKCSSR
jgi:hypothetical protein